MDAEDRYVPRIHSPYHGRYHEDGHVRKRSRSPDHDKERRSRSRSYIQDSGDMCHRESNWRAKSSDSSKKSGLERDYKRRVSHDRKDNHGTRYRWNDREREQSSSSSMHGSKHKGKDEESERSSSSCKHARREDKHGNRGSVIGEERVQSSRFGGQQRGENRRVSPDLLENDRLRESSSERKTEKTIGQDFNKQRERKELDLELLKDSRHSEHRQPGYCPDNKSVHRSKGSSCLLEDSKASEDRLKVDDDVQVSVMLLAEEDIDEIREKSRKIIEAAKERARNKKKQVECHVHSEVKDDLRTNGKPVEQIPCDKELVNSAPKGSIGVHNGSSVARLTLERELVTLEGSSLAGPLGDGVLKSERSPDMFSDDFGQSPVGVCEVEKGLQGERKVLNDDCDDAEGYYSIRFGELLQNRYEVIATHGKGVFSTVVRAKDHKPEMGEPGEVAIKIIRNNHIMNKAGEGECKILKRLADADPGDRCHCVRFLWSFKHRTHLCLVFESLYMNLRAVVKKFGRDIGLNLDAVGRYAKQLFMALKHLEDCGVLHSDIKPDNILVNEAKNKLKLCDFGNAMLAGENERTPYLVSRFYRAPEVILGLQYHHPMDMWSVGCCLYELYSGRILFPGSSNNEMLRLHMELKGPFPKKMLKKGLFTKDHFDRDMNFKVEGSVTKQTKPRTIGTMITGSLKEDPKKLADFKDLLEKMFTLDPEKRVKATQALNHPFITDQARCREVMSSNCKNTNAQ